MAKKQWYYAVAEGKKRGIYLTWDECSENVIGFSGAVYKKFDSKDDAQDFIDTYISNLNNS